MFVGCVCGTSPLGRPADSDIETPDTGPVDPLDPGTTPDPGVVVPGEVCRSVGPDVPPAPRLVDIIMAIDNSGAMTSEITSVQNNINAHFADLLDQSGVDYRVILVSQYGRAADERVCIQAPLGGSDNCGSPPEIPMNGDRFFHYDQQITDRDALGRLYLIYDAPDRHGSTPEGWSYWLRAGSLRAFIVVGIGDEQVFASVDSFESGLAAKGFFGSGPREYTFHSIVGVPANNPVTSPWLPSAPLMSAKCGGATYPGTRFQTLSMRTGGLRFPVCEVSHYDAAFEAIAFEIARAAGVRCEMTPPAPPADYRYGSIDVEYTSTGGTVEQLALVTDPSGCTALGFLRDAVTDRVTLCPQACVRLRADPSASVAAHYTCEAPLP